MAHPDCWSKSLGARSGTVRVYERSPGGMLQVSLWLPEIGERRVSLGHKDKIRGLKEARALAQLRGSDPGPVEPVAGLTIERLFERYVAEGRYLPDGSLKTDGYLRHVEQTGRFLAKFYGGDLLVTTLTPDRIRDYVVWRRQGGGSGHPSKANTVRRDLGMFKAALNWACQRYDNGKPLIERHVLQGVRLPTEKDPRQPVLEEEMITGLLTIAPDIHPFLRTLILMAQHTGRRLSSILALRWDDVDFVRGKIHWRAEYDKIRKSWFVPMHSAVVAELKQFRKARGAIGSALLFPHPQRRRHHDGPVTRHLAAFWLKEAFRRGKLEKPAGSLWHMFRRVWATARKDLPSKDVAAAGGWLDVATLLRYQQPDDATLRRVVEFERPSPARETLVETHTQARR